MPKKYRSGFERLGRIHPDTDSRYSTALIAIRDNFSGFAKKDGFDARKPGKLTDAQKHQIRRYYNLLSEYTEGANVYKMTPSELPRTIKKGGRKNVEAVMRAAQMPQGRKRAKYIFVKYDGETIPRVKIKNGAPVFVVDKFGTEKETIELNKFALAADPIGTIQSIKPLVEGAKYFRIMNGRHEFSHAADLNTLGRQVQRLQEKYAIGTADNWQRWLHGVAAYYTDKRAIDIIAYNEKTRREFRERVQREGRKLRRKRK